MSKCVIQCPYCDLKFQSTREYLELRNGMIRCEKCFQVIDGVRHQLDSAPLLSPPLSSPPALSPPASTAPTNKITPYESSLINNATHILPSITPSTPVKPPVKAPALSRPSPRTTAKISLGDASELSDFFSDGTRQEPASRQPATSPSISLIPSITPRKPDPDAVSFTNSTTPSPVAEETHIMDDHGILADHAPASFTRNKPQAAVTQLQPALASSGMSMPSVPDNYRIVDEDSHVYATRSRDNKASLMLSAAAHTPAIPAPARNPHRTSSWMNSNTASRTGLEKNAEDGHNALWPIVVFVGLIGLLFAQYIYFNFYKLYTAPATHFLMSYACKSLGCLAPDFDAFNIVSDRINLVPAGEKAELTRIQFSLTNIHHQQQPFPAIRFATRLPNKQSAVILVQPREYLNRNVFRSQHIQPKSTIEGSFEINLPRSSIGTYSITPIYWF